MSRPTFPTYKTRNWPAYNEALKGLTASPRTALDLLARIQKHTAHIGARIFTGTGRTTPEQRDLFDALSRPKPA